MCICNHGGNFSLEWILNFIQLFGIVPIFVFPLQQSIEPQRSYCTVADCVLLYLEIGLRCHQYDSANAKIAKATLRINTRVVFALNSPRQTYSSLLLFRFIVFRCAQTTRCIITVIQYSSFSEPHSSHSGSRIPILSNYHFSRIYSALIPVPR